MVTHADRMSGMEMKARRGSASKAVRIDHIGFNPPQEERKQRARAWVNSCSACLDLRSKYM
jgi:hypothetical protein